MTLSGSASRARVVRPRRRSDPNCALADLDHRVLGVLCDHRVVRQDQLGRLFPEVPERTLRYRTRRLHQLGLAGRSRPYRERGSAPNHHWPTRRADALVCGETLPRGGERHVPNPVFLAHAAALTELYVAFATDSRLALTEFRREPREPFSDSRQDRVLAPDALLVFANERQEASSAFVEIDLGTMSHTRLRLHPSASEGRPLRGVRHHGRVARALRVHARAAVPHDHRRTGEQVPGGRQGTTRAQNRTPGQAGAARRCGRGAPLPHLRARLAGRAARCRRPAKGALRALLSATPNRSSRKNGV